MTESLHIFKKYPILAEMRLEVEKEMQTVLRSEFPDSVQGLRSMLEYHLGWKDGNSPGKRMRPLFLLVACHAAGGEWHKALPAAVAVEFIHNFSLIHDDIEDHSLTRHLRSTLWAQVGVPQAINAGDALLLAGNKKIWELESDYPLALVQRCSLILEQATLNLTRGQFLDISFESRDLITREEYFQMIQGKTTALISACTQIGAMLGQYSPQTEMAFTQYGTNLGLAYQIIDDYLGIWGKEETTGKSTATDIIHRKKSFPVVLGLTLVEQFRSVWESQSEMEPVADQLASILVEHGIQQATIEQANEFTRKAKLALQDGCQHSEAYPLMSDLTSWLLTRNM